MGGSRTARVDAPPRPHGAGRHDRRAAAASAWADLACAALAVSLVVALAASALAHRAAFFLNDDFRTYFIPLMGEVSRLVAHGELPLVTDRVWYGGAMLAEYQLGLLNPVCLALSILVGRMTDLAAAAAIYAIAHLAIFAAGTYTLCRVLRCGRGPAFLAALVAPTSEWIFYWGASNWIPFLTSLAWAPWAWAGLIACARDPRWTPAAAAGVAMVLLAGCPFTDLALMMSVLIAAAVTASRGQAAIRRALPDVLAVACGGLLAAPALLPIPPYLESASRPISPMLNANLEALAGVGAPFMVTRWTVFGGAHELVRIPMLHVSWFVLAALANAPWRTLGRKPEAQVLLLCIGAFAAASLTTGFWQFRWMFRMLPYYQFALAALAAVALAESQASGARWRPVATTLALAVPLWVALWQEPALSNLYISAAVLIGLLGVLAVRLQPSQPLPFALTLAGGHVALFLLVGAAFAALPNVYRAYWPAPTVRTASTEPALTRYTIFTRPIEAFTGDDWIRFRPGNTSLERPGVTVNGYSPFHFVPYERAFCLDYLGSAACPDIVTRLSRPLTDVGRSALDLARVQEVRIQKPEHARTFGALHPDWTAQFGADGSAAFRRSTDFALPAPVSDAPADARVRTLSASSAQVALDVRSASGGRVILARAWYPGWRASLDGRPVRTAPVDGIFVAAELPAAASGRLTFTYWPKGLTAGLAAAVAGAVALLLGTFRLWR